MSVLVYRQLFSFEILAVIFVPRNCEVGNIICNILLVVIKYLFRDVATALNIMVKVDWRILFSLVQT